MVTSRDATTFFKKGGNVPGVGVPELGYITTFLKQMPTYPHSNSTWGTLPFLHESIIHGEFESHAMQVWREGGGRGGRAHAKSIILAFIFDTIPVLFCLLFLFWVWVCLCCLRCLVCYCFRCFACIGFVLFNSTVLFGFWFLFWFILDLFLLFDLFSSVCGAPAGAGGRAAGLVAGNWTRGR